MATCQLLGFSVLSAAIDRPNRMDHVFRGEASAGSDDGFSSGQVSDFAHNFPALGEDGRPPRPVNGAIDSASAQKRRIRRIHDRVGHLLSNIGGTDEFESSRAVQQDPNCEVLHARIQTDHFLSVNASTPGSFLPSRNSSDAPPPVEMWVILSATSAPCTAATGSPPPTIEMGPALSASAWAILNVPRENPGTSKTPMGPFHRMVRAV